MKIYVVGMSIGYANWMQGDIIYDIEKADLVVFTGGADIAPKWYNEKAHSTVYYSLARDMHEIEQYKIAKKFDKKMIGICRGAQLFCVMNGGRLIQHQQNPDFMHDIRTFDKHILPMSSLHHQAQYPWNLPKKDYYILAWTKRLSKYHLNGKGKNLKLPNNIECEVTFFPKTQCFGIQGHPEMLYYAEHIDSTTTIAWCRSMLNLFMEEKLEQTIKETK